MIAKALLLGTAALAASIGAASAQPPGMSHAGGYVHRFVSKTPRGAQTLYDQNENDAGYAVLSDDFGSGDYNSQAADDFAVPAGFTWIVTKIDVTGVYFNGYGPSDGQNVYFYKDRNGKPGKLIQEFDHLNGVDSAGSFAITLPGKGIKLKTGKYWLSVQAGMNFATGGEWGWEVSIVQHNDEAMWQNPGGGFGTCLTWAPIENCFGADYVHDLMFDLKGKSRSVAAD
jgi:hypothetical protein